MRKRDSTTKSCEHGGALIVTDGHPSTVVYGLQRGLPLELCVLGATCFQIGVYDKALQTFRRGGQT